MALIKLYNLARMTTATTGTGTITLGSAATVNSVLYLSFANSGVLNGEVVMYGISDTNNSEVGYGTYTSAGTTLTRNVLRSTNSNNAINLSGSAQVFILGTAETAICGGITPQGRLTLSSGVPVMTSDVSGATTVYYTPYVGNICPTYNGAADLIATNNNFTELNQTLADTTKSPAATTQDTCYDYFFWNDAGTMRCTRGLAWSYASTVTMTIASPCVVTWNAHGLNEGQPVVFTTTGALPTGITAGTTYYISKGPATNTFSVSTTVANAVAGTSVNTSGSQSGTHTATNGDKQRSASCPVAVVANGLFVNTAAVTNGPAAYKGLYVGTIRTNPSNQVDYILGGRAAGGTAAVLYVWNAYNRRTVFPTVTNTTGSYAWTPSAAVTRAAALSATMRISYVCGLQEDFFQAAYHAIGQNSVAWSIGIGNNSTGTFSGSGFYGGLTTAETGPGSYRTTALGGNYFAALEYTNVGTTTFYGAPGTGVDGLVLSAQLAM